MNTKALTTRLPTVLLPFLWAPFLSANLPNIPGLALHLNAGNPDSLVLSDTMAVNQWNDSSGQAISFSPTIGSPVFVDNVVNGLPVIRFNQDVLETTSPAAMGMTNDIAGFTAFAVAWNTGTSSQNIFRVGRGDGGTAAGLRVMLGRTDTQHRFLARQVDSGGFATVSSGAGTLSPETWGVDAGVVDYANATAAIYINGEQTASIGPNSNLGPGNTSATDSQRFWIGSDHSTQYWIGDIAEILMYNRALSESEIFEINSYLGNKYGIDIIPEPSTYTLIVAGAVGVLLFLRRRRLG